MLTGAISAPASGAASVSAAADEEIVVLPRPLRDRLLAEIKRRLPVKSFGYLISTGDPRTPDDFLIFESNIRNSAEWKGKFEAYGPYFLEHEDAGFVATPEESWQMQKRMWARGMTAVGVFHSHLRHPANFSLIDYEMHVKGFKHLWHMIVSVRNVENVQIRAFCAAHGGVRELPVAITPAAAVAVPSRFDGAALSLGRDGRPLVKDSRAIFSALTELLRSGNRHAINESLINGFLRGSAARYRQYVSPAMRIVPSARFEMGSEHLSRAHFVGESPRHTVTLPAFKLACVPVTNEMFGLYDERWLGVPAADLRKPAVNVTWYDAAVFAMWMGCRLPTEAEWEFACGGGAPGEWSCGGEELLPLFAWYSDNSNGRAHEVGSLRASALGLFDMHGNVWEWCADGYDQDYYAHSPGFNPTGAPPAHSDKVCRGGSFHALAEMCRTRYRFHDPPDFSAWDLGFRLASDIEPPALEVASWLS